MARITPADRAKKKHEHWHGRRHHIDPAKVARNKQQHHTASGVSAFGALNPAQFGYSGGFTTDAGNYTGVQAIEGAAGNGGAGGSDSGGAPS